MRPRIAVITTVYRPLSHTDVIVSRWLEPRPTDPEFGWPLQPRTDIASLYIEQFPENDIGRETAARYGVPIYNTVRDALTLGGDKLAVDGVLLIAEHGEYPLNQWHQKMYPRRELFDAIVAVFRDSGRSVPIFNDKHLSYDASSSFHMAGTARELGFGLMSGSSVPIAGCMEAWPLPDGAPLAAGVGIFNRGIDINGYHSIEFLQSLVARRAGGETGIASVTAYHGDTFVQGLSDGLWSADLMNAALEQARQVPASTYQEAIRSIDTSSLPYSLPAAFSFQHLDGLQTTYLAFAVQPAEFTVAVAESDGSISGGCSPLSIHRPDFFCPHFAMLAARIEEFFLTGQTPYPPEHSLLCTLATEAACHAMATPGRTIETPQLHLSYHLRTSQE